MHDNLKTPEEIATWMRASKTEREYEAKTGKTVSKGEKRAARNRAAKPSAPEPAETEPQFTAEQEKAEAVFLESLKSLLVESADQPKFLPADKVTHYSNVFGAEQLPAKQRMEAGWELLAHYAAKSQPPNHPAERNRAQQRMAKIRKQLDRLQVILEAGDQNKQSKTKFDQLDQLVERYEQVLYAIEAEVKQGNFAQAEKIVEDNQALVAELSGFASLSDYTLTRKRLNQRIGQIEQMMAKPPVIKAGGDSDRPDDDLGRDSGAEHFPDDATDREPQNQACGTGHQPPRNPLPPTGGGGSGPTGPEDEPQKEKFIGNVEFVQEIASNNLAEYRKWLLDNYNLDDATIEQLLGSRLAKLLAGDVKSYLALVEEKKPFNGNQEFLDEINNTSVPHLKRWLMDNYGGEEDLRMLLGQAFEDLGLSVAAAEEQLAADTSETLNKFPKDQKMLLTKYSVFYAEPFPHEGFDEQAQIEAGQRLAKAFDLIGPDKVKDLAFKIAKANQVTSSGMMDFDASQTPEELAKFISDSIPEANRLEEVNKRAESMEQILDDKNFQVSAWAYGDERLSVMEKLQQVVQTLPKIDPPIRLDIRASGRQEIDDLQRRVLTITDDLSANGMREKIQSFMDRLRPPDRVEAAATGPEKFPPAVLESMVRVELSKNDKIQEISRLNISIVRNQMNLTAEMKTTGGKVKIETVIVDTGKGLVIKSNEITANLITKALIKAKMPEDPLAKVKERLEQDRKKKIKSLRIKDDQLVVEFE